MYMYRCTCIHAVVILVGDTGDQEQLTADMSCSVVHRGGLYIHSQYTHRGTGGEDGRERRGKSEKDGVWE